MKIKKLLKSWRIMLLLVVLLFSFIAINHQFGEQGVIIKSVEANSIAAGAGIKSPDPNLQPTQRERIISINNRQVKLIEDYLNEMNSIPQNSTVRITTNKKEYVFIKSSESIGIDVAKSPRSNLRKGLELQGGTRVLLQPQKKVSDQDIKDIIDTMQSRLNVYGLTDLKIKPATDFLDNRYIVVEIAGITKEEVKEVIASQGRFEAKIGDDLVFEGGQRDITFVCRNDGTCSGVRNCNRLQDGYSCTFEFRISLSPEAAKKHADVTGKLEINITASGNRYLSKPLELYLDDNLVDTLQISSDLKGQEATQILISGPGSGLTEQEAIQDAVKNMNKLQTVLITGSLPTKLDIVKLDTISPLLGEEFTKNIFRVAILAAIAVSLIIFIRYRSLKISLPIIFVTLSEVYIVLGFAALFRYNLDLAAIAGLIAAVGTGVDDQIVITDEVMNKEQYYGGIKERIKRAFFIIMGAYLTTVAAMLPLLKAGAGLLTGFAIVTIAGVSVGVFITRPAFAEIIKHLLEE